MGQTPSRLRTLDLTYIALSAVLITVCAWISIPAPVPFTLQTFAVFFALLTLGGRRGMLAILTYLMMGTVGLPVFTGFHGGLGVLLGATGGYLLGFIVMALVYRAIAHVGKDSSAAGLAAMHLLFRLYQGQSHGLHVHKTVQVWNPDTQDNLLRPAFLPNGRTFLEGPLPNGM